MYKCQGRRMGVHACTWQELAGALQLRACAAHLCERAREAAVVEAAVVVACLAVVGAGAAAAALGRQRDAQLAANGAPPSAANRDGIVDVAGPNQQASQHAGGAERRAGGRRRRVAALAAAVHVVVAAAHAALAVRHAAAVHAGECAADVDGLVCPVGERQQAEELEQLLPKRQLQHL